MRLWFDCVDEVVFTDEDFNNDMTNLNSMPIGPRRDKVQALQAAFMVCLYQNWQGSDASKRRIRRRRFATLVSVSLPYRWPRNCVLVAYTNFCRPLAILTLPQYDI